MQQAVRLFTVVLALLCAFATFSAQAGGNWPSFRGAEAPRFGGFLLRASYVQSRDCCVANAATWGLPHRARPIPSPAPQPSRSSKSFP